MSKAHAARELGANETILYRGLSVDDYVKKYTDGRGYDVVFDTVGGDNLDASFQQLAMVEPLSISQHDQCMI